MGTYPPYNPSRDFEEAEYRVRKVSWAHVQGTSMPTRLATACQSQTATQSPSSMSAQTSSSSSVTRSQFRSPVYPRTARTALRTRSRRPRSKQAIPTSTHGIRSKVCAGSEGLKDSSMFSDSSTALMSRGSSRAGRRFGGGDDVRETSNPVPCEPCESPSCIEFCLDGLREDGQLCGRPSPWRP